MFSGLFKNMKDAFPKGKSGSFIVVCFLGVLLYGLYQYTNLKSLTLDSFSDGDVNAPTSNDSVAKSVNTEDKQLVNQSRTFGLQDVANPKELLPIDTNSQWEGMAPSNNGDIPDLLTAGQHIGLDTIGQTLKNANLQLRSDPIIPKSETGPWNQSTIETDFARTPLEIGPYKC